MRNQPPAPKRATYIRTITVDSGDSIEKILETLSQRDVKPAEATFQYREILDYDRCCDYAPYYGEIEITYKEPESEEHWETRLVNHRKRLASWREWYDNHEEEIQAHLATKIVEKNEQLTRSEKRARKSLEKEEKTLEKRLQNLKRRLHK